MTEPTLKQWKRRALKAESELEVVREIRRHEFAMEIKMARELAICKVALNEIRDSAQWAGGDDE